MGARRELPGTLPADLGDGSVSLRTYTSDDADELFAALSDEQVWEHQSRSAPTGPGELDAVIRAKTADGRQVTFIVRADGGVVGVTSVVFDPDEPDGAEIGGTLLDPRVWGTGVNGRMKAMLLDELFRGGADWVQLRTDERNARSAAAIRRLGASELGVRDEPHLRRDGSRRRSLMFRIARPSGPMPDVDATGPRSSVQGGTTTEREDTDAERSRALRDHRT